MKHSAFLQLLSGGIFLNTFAQENDSTTQKNKKHIIVYHDVLVPPFSYAINQRPTSRGAWWYLSGGIGYVFSDKHQLSLNYTYEYHKSEPYIDDYAIYNAINAGVLPNSSSVSASNRFSKSLYIIPSYKHFFFRKKAKHSFVLNLGLGGGMNKISRIVQQGPLTYSINNFQWCGLTDIGYRFKFKQLTISPFVGLISAFTFKSKETFIGFNPNQANAKDLYEHDKIDSHDLKDLYFKETYIIRQYKTFGISRPESIGRLGIDIGYMF